MAAESVPSRRSDAAVAAARSTAHTAYLWSGGSRKHAATAAATAVLCVAMMASVWRSKRKC